MSLPPSDHHLLLRDKCSDGQDRTEALNAPHKAFSDWSVHTSSPQEVPPPWQLRKLCEYVFFFSTLKSKWQISSEESSAQLPEVQPGKLQYSDYRRGSSDRLKGRCDTYSIKYSWWWLSMCFSNILCGCVGRCCCEFWPDSQTCWTLTQFTQVKHRWVMFVWAWTLFISSASSCCESVWNHLSDGFFCHKIFYCRLKSEVTCPDVRMSVHVRRDELKGVICNNGHMLNSDRRRHIVRVTTDETSWNRHISPELLSKFRIIWSLF